MTLDQLLNFKVMPLSMYSDHCQIVTYLAISNHMLPTASTTIAVTYVKPCKYVWCDDGKTSFLNNLGTLENMDRIEKLSDPNRNCCTEELLSECTEMYNSAARKSLKTIKESISEGMV